VRVSATGIHPRVQIHWHNAAGGWLGPSTEPDYTPSAANTWIERVFTAVAPTLATQMKLSCACNFSTGGLTGSVWIDDGSFNPTYLLDVPMTAVGDHWELALDANTLTAFGDVTWWSYSFDGTLYSGARTTRSSAVLSPAATFTYALGPLVTVQAPTVGQVITSSTPTFQWTCSTQNRYRVRVYEAGTDTVAYERGWITSTSVKQWTVEAGFLRNNHAYEAEIGCEDTTPLQGFSARIPFTTAYTPPATPGSVSAMPYRIGSDPWPTAILVQAAAAVNNSLFVGRFVYRDDITDRPLAKLDSPGDVAFIDPHPRSGVQHVYTWRDVYYVDSSHTEQIESAGVSVTASVTLRGTVLSSVDDPVGVRCYLVSVQERRRKLTQDKTKITKWGRKKPTSYYGTAEYWSVPHTVRLYDDHLNGVTAIDRERELETVLLSHAVLCYRDERGRKYFVTIDDPELIDVRVLASEGDLTLTEEDYDEGYFVIDAEFTVQ
jgi:hypothetical protein